MSFKVAIRMIFGSWRIAINSMISEEITVMIPGSLVHLLILIAI